MKSKFEYACFQGNLAFSDAINRFSTKKYHFLLPPTMLHCSFPLSSGGDKKQGPPQLPSPKASLPPLPALTVAPTEPPSVQLEPPSPPALLPLPNFSDINGDLSPHCPLRQEFLPLPPTTFADANAIMFVDSAMKSAEAGAPLHYHNKKILTLKNLFIQPDYLEMYNHIPPNFTMFGKILLKIWFTRGKLIT